MNWDKDQTRNFYRKKFRRKCSPKFFPPNCFPAEIFSAEIPKSPPKLLPPKFFRRNFFRWNFWGIMYSKLQTLGKFPRVHPSYIENLLKRKKMKYFTHANIEDDHLTKSVGIVWIETIWLGTISLAIICSPTKLRREKSAS